MCGDDGGCSDSGGDGKHFDPLKEIAEYKAASLLYVKEARCICVSGKYVGTCNLERICLAVSIFRIYIFFISFMPNQ